MTRTVRALACALAIFLVAPAVAHAWGNPQLDIACDQATGEIVGVYDNDTFAGDIRLRLDIDGRTVVDQDTGGNHAEIRYPLPAGDHDVSLLAQERPRRGVDKRASKRMSCAVPPAPAAPAPPAAAPPAPAVVAPPARPAGPSIAERRADSRRHRARERRMERQARRRGTAHHAPESTG